MANYLFEMQSELTREFPGWRVAFTVESPTAEAPSRMCILDETRTKRASVPFPETAQRRGDNVYRALFAVLLERVREAA
jgi:hypothetical protein